MGYPSEPLITECAAQCMNCDKIKLEDLIHPLIDFVQQDVVEGGYHGELVSRILLMLAWDTSCLVIVFKYG